jgi:hypothetical protein
MNNSKDILLIKLQITSEQKNKKRSKIFTKDKKINNIIIDLHYKDENIIFRISISEGKITNLYINDKIIGFPQISDNIKEYETLNIVSETGDSVYSPTVQELPIKEENGQVFFSEDKVEGIIQRELEKRLGVLQQEK